MVPPAINPDASEAAAAPLGLVVGAGPAGLMAAEEISRLGLRVLVAEAKPSPARKFLMAGKSGLNITKDAPAEAFLAAYAEAAPALQPMLAKLGADQVEDWARSLGQPVFTGSSGRVFPKAMKASPLLRAWLGRLAGQGVTLKTRWRWAGWEGATGHRFHTPDGMKTIHPSACVLALGGASWARLGSDGLWADTLSARGVSLAPFRPANVAITVPWSDHMTPHFGTPLKSTRFCAGDLSVLGEAVLTQRGLEGSAIYALSRSLRDGAALTLDLAPDLELESLTARLARPRGKLSLSNHLRRVTQLAPVKRALLREVGPLPSEPAALARRIKRLSVPFTGTRPMDEAISVAGGIRWDAVNADLMLTACPGTFAAGEMLDWEAPTGGYLITACLATGAHAGRAAAAWARRSSDQ